LKER
jgi:hypothetical protein